MARVYYGSKISDNITKLPNGCLICLNVPIARTGTYKYLRSELGLDGNGNEIINVNRGEEEVFDKRAIASFEGKAFTDSHPPCDVTSDNWSQYGKGMVTNVRRGTGSDSSFLLADIMVHDPITIDEILSGAKREVSCGYDCEYCENDDGEVYQKNIIGNHVALVQNGRAGSQVRIKDEKIKVNSKYRFIKKLIDVINNI